MSVVKREIASECLVITATVSFHVVHLLLVSKLVFSHSTWVPFHNIGRVLSSVFYLMHASVLIIVKQRVVLSCLKLLLAFQGFSCLLTVDLREAVNYDGVLLLVVERVHEEFFLHKHEKIIDKETAGGANCFQLTF